MQEQESLLQSISNSVGFWTLSATRTPMSLRMCIVHIHIAVLFHGRLNPRKHDLILCLFRLWGRGEWLQTVGIPQ